jgi:hypothetical protein
LHPDGHKQSELVGSTDDAPAIVVLGTVGEMTQTTLETFADDPNGSRPLPSL